MMPITTVNGREFTTKTPKKENKTNSAWMKDSLIRKVPINRLCIPGSHDSSANKDNSTADIGSFLIQNFAVTQDFNIYKQLQSGIRALDIRVIQGYDKDKQNRFFLHHGPYYTGKYIEDLFNCLINFVKEDPSEIVFVDFHEFSRDKKDFDHKLFISLIETHLKEFLIPRDSLQLNIEALTREYPGKNIIACYNSEFSSDLLWDGINQFWIGSNTPSTSKLYEYISSKVDKIKTEHYLTAIQSAKYNKIVFTPDDFSDKIDEWFHYENENSFIMNFNIINTDWTTRSNIVSNCIKANRKKGEIYQR